LLLITAQERGAAFTASAATGTLLGLVTLAGFVLVYVRAAAGAGWVVSLLAGWGCAAGLGGLLQLVAAHVVLPVALVAATVTLAAAYRALPSPEAQRDPPNASKREVVLRMGATTMLVIALAVAAQLLGSRVGGMLAGLPVLASVLAACTHRRDGAATLVALLGGMLAGMAGFVAFCAVVAVLIVPAGTAPTFALATLGALGLQVLAATRPSVLGWVRA
jgi:hypothetical protein